MHTAVVRSSQFFFSPLVIEWRRWCCCWLCSLSVRVCTLFLSIVCPLLLLSSPPILWRSWNLLRSISIYFRSAFFVCLFVQIFAKYRNIFSFSNERRKKHTDLRLKDIIQIDRNRLTGSRPLSLSPPLSPTPFVPCLTTSTNISSILFMIYVNMSNIFVVSCL